MRFEVLASSSKGNAYILDDKQTRILLECGIAHRTLQKLSGFTLSEMSGCLVSHEHKDHAKCVKDIIGDGIPVYMSEGTAEALFGEGSSEEAEQIATAPAGPRNDSFLEAVTVIRDREQFNVGSFDVVPFSTFHDAAEPLGFLIRSRVDGEVLAFATDTVNLRYRFPGLNILAIEANFDKAILERCEKMPEKVRHRIACTHMEIDVLCEYLRGLDLTKCREVHLLHLSDATSHEGHFINKARRAVPPWVSVTASRK